MMYCVMTRLEIMELRRIVDRYDGTAFITLSDISEIIGEHIKKTSSKYKDNITKCIEKNSTFHLLFTISAYTRKSQCIHTGIHNDTGSDKVHDFAMKRLCK